MEFFTSIDRVGSNLLYRGYKDGRPIKQKIKYEPTLFVNSEKGDWKSLIGNEKLAPVKFSSMGEATSFIKQYKDVRNFDVHGLTNFKYGYIQERFPDVITPNIDDMTILMFDIEVYSGDGFPEPDEAKHPILSISAETNKSDRIIMWGLHEFDHELKYLDTNEFRDVEYREFETEYDMVKDFIVWWASHECNPDIVSGWNTNLFDIPYLINRSLQMFGEEFIKLLSPWGKLNFRRVKANFREQDYYDIMGIQQLDYLDLFKKFAYTYGAQESYKLDNIANVVLNKSKLDYSGYKNLQDLYDRNKQKFYEYNLLDTRLIKDLDTKLGLFGLVMSMAGMAGVNASETLGTTTIWDIIIYRKLFKDKVAIPPTKSNNRDKFPGAYVKPTIPGMFDWIMSFDLNSLYPNLIVQYNISPETLIGDKFTSTSVDEILMGESDNPIPETTMTPNGIHYCSREKRIGVLPAIIEDYYAQRVSVKKQMLDVKSAKESITDPVELLKAERLSTQLENRQMALKILLNSMYGATGSPYFRYYDLRIAQGITEAGQLTIKSTISAVNAFINKCANTTVEDYVIAGDTDSGYFNFSKIVELVNPKDPVDFLDKLGKEAVVPLLDREYQSLADRVSNGFNRMAAGREAIGKGLFVAKKRYIMRVFDNEGVRYATPKLKVMGLEAIKSSTPEVCRSTMKELFEVIMNGDEQECQDRIAKFKEEFMTMDPELIAAPRGVSNVTKYKDPDKIYRKGAQAHIRAALLYNFYLAQTGAYKDYDYINNGDKLRFIHLMQPNPINDNVIGMIDKLPEEFGLHRFIDYDKQFNKVFLEPFTIIMDTIGWKAEKVASLDDFFN